MPCLAINDLIFRAAPSLISIMCLWSAYSGRYEPDTTLLITGTLRLRARLRVLGLGPGALQLVLLLLVVGNRRLDRVFREHRTVNLHRRQRQLGDDVGVLDGERLVDRLALEPLGCEARAGNRGAAPERLELRVVDDAGV